MNKINARSREDDFTYYLSNLLKMDKIDSPTAKGIAKLLLDKGADNLTPSQERTFIKYGLGSHNYIEECEMCLIDIPWSEMLDALDDYLCGHCRNQQEKILNN